MLTLSILVFFSPTLQAVFLGIWSEVLVQIWSATSSQGDLHIEYLGDKKFSLPQSLNFSLNSSITLKDITVRLKWK